MQTPLSPEEFENKVTVLMPVHNGNLQWLDLAITSILIQTYTNFELLIVNDGSNEETVQHLESWAAKDNRIRLIHFPKNLGIIEALNNGLQQVRTKYVARMDGDDFSNPDRLELQIKYAKEHPEYSIIASNIFLIGTNNCSNRCEHNDDNRLVLMWNTCFAHPSVLMKTEDILQLGGYPSQFLYAEDYALWCKASLQDKKMCVLSPVLLQYRPPHSTSKYGNVQVQSALEIRQWYLNAMCEKYGVTPPPCGYHLHNSFFETIKIFRTFNEIAHHTESFPMRKRDLLTTLRKIKRLTVFDNLRLTRTQKQWLLRLIKWKLI